MHSSTDSEAAVQYHSDSSILHPLSALQWSDCTGKLPRSSCDKIRAVYVPQQSTLYVSTNASELYFCSGPFSGPKITWKGPHNSVRKKKIVKYALAVYRSDLAIVGGWSEINRCSMDEVLILHSTSSLENLPDKMLTKRYSAVAVGNEDYLAVAGGEAEDRKFVADIEVYDGKHCQWVGVKSLPKELQGLTSILHNDGVWYLIEENEVGFTYSAPLEQLLSQETEWQMMDRCSSGEMLIAPVSFDGQLLIIKRKWHSGYGIHMLSPKMKSWVNIAPLESSDKIQHASMVGLPEGRLMMITDSAVKIATVNVTDFVKDDKFSLMSLMKLEHGCGIPVLTSLRGRKLWNLKDKAVFELKFDKTNGSDEPAENLYMNSWLEDGNAGCPPTWNNLLVLLKEVKLEEVAKNSLAVLSSSNQYSLGDLHITTDTGVKALLNLQSQLGSLCIPANEKSVQDLMGQVQQHCHLVMWKQKEIKRCLEKVREQLSKDIPKIVEEKRLKDILLQGMKQSFVGRGILPTLLTRKRSADTESLLVISDQEYAHTAPSTKVPRQESDTTGDRQEHKHEAPPTKVPRQESDTTDDHQEPKHKEVIQLEGPCSSSMHQQVKASKQDSSESSDENILLPTLKVRVTPIQTYSLYVALLLLQRPAEQTEYLLCLYQCPSEELEKLSAQGFISSMSHLRLIKIMKGPVMYMLQDIFKDRYGRKWKMSDGRQLLQDLQKNGIKFDVAQVKHLKDGDVTEWDVSLLCRILLCHKSGRNIWKLCSTEEEEIKTLREIRNEVMHSNKVSDNKFDLVVKAIKYLLRYDIRKQERVINAVTTIQKDPIDDEVTDTLWSAIKSFQKDLAKIKRENS